MARFLNDRPRDTRWDLAWFIATGFFAFSIGTAFRLAETTGAGLFRMFGTFLLIILGYCATQGIRALYSRQARSQVLAALEGAPGVALVSPKIRTKAGILRPSYLWAGPRGLVSVFVSERTFGKQRLPAELIRAERKSQQLLELFSREIKRLWPVGEVVTPAVEAAVILIRQPGLPIPKDFEGRRIHLLNPEGFQQYLKAAGANPLNDREALAILENLGFETPAAG